jgi:hypothetical protein
LLMFLNISLIAGAILARQFKVMILAPALLAAGALDLYLTIAHHYGPSAVALTIVVSTIGLEIGYLVGLSIPYAPPSRRI